jgi:hypothetical protein
MDNGIYNTFGDQIGYTDASGNAIYDTPGEVATNATTGDNGSGGTIPSVTSLLSTTGTLATGITGLLGTLGVIKPKTATVAATPMTSQAKMLIIGGVLAAILVVVMLFRSK